VTVDIGIPLEEAAARVLEQDPLKRQAVGQLISRWLQPDGRGDRLLASMDRLAAEAQAKGLTQDRLDAELAAYNAERRR
jgi:hypothetical protein